MSEESSDSPELPPQEAPPADDGWIDVTPARRPPPEGTPSASPPPGRGLPLGWALLLLPAFALGGWFLGQMPGSARHGTTGADAREAAVAPNDASAPLGREEMPPPLVNPHESGALEAELGKPSRWMTSITAAEAESRRTGKPILVDFNAAWCGPCRAMRQEVFDDARLGGIVRRLVVPVSIVDRSREDGSNSPEVEELMQGYSIDAFPTLIVYRPGGERTLRTTGFGGADRTLDWIRHAARVAR